MKDEDIKKITTIDEEEDTPEAVDVVPRGEEDKEGI